VDKTMNKKIITTLVAVTIVSGLLSSIFVRGTQIKSESLSADQLYINAYSLTTQAMNQKSQRAINSARAAILQLQNTEAAWAIGEFSRQVDQVQHPILVRIVEGIKIAELNPTQVNINQAKGYIDSELPEIWRNSYSSAVDTIQQGPIKKAAAAYEKAIRTQSQTDIDLAVESINELLKAKDPTVNNWAGTIKKQLEDNLSFTVISIN
jgi:hypothetical protein